MRDNTIMIKNMGLEFLHGKKWGGAIILKNYIFFLYKGMMVDSIKAIGKTENSMVKGNI